MYMLAVYLLVYKIHMSTLTSLSLYHGNWCEFPMMPRGLVRCRSREATEEISTQSIQISSVQPRPHYFM